VLESKRVAVVLDLTAVANADGSFLFEIAARPLRPDARAACLKLALELGRLGPGTRGRSIAANSTLSNLGGLKL